MSLRVLFIAPHPVEGPSTRFRICQFLPFLEANGIACEVRPFFTSAEARAIYRDCGTGRKVALTLRAALRRLGDIARAGRFDIVYILREAFPFGPPLVERALRRRAGRMVFDFDDAIDLPSSAYDNPLDRLRDFSKPATLVRLADMVVPGSRWLAGRALAMGADPARVEVLPTVVDAGLFRPAPRRAAGEGPVVGWIGTPRNTAYLRPLTGVIAALARRHPGIRFRFVGAERFDCGGLPVEFRDWALEREVAEIQGFDIGIMPLPDDDFARGKCGFKLIEYMACGLPTVASPVGANLDILREGETGFLARDPKGWEDALSALAQDPALRARMGAAGRARVEAQYCLAAVAPRLLATLRRAAEGAA